MTKQEEHKLQEELEKIVHRWGIDSLLQGNDTQTALQRPYNNLASSSGSDPAGDGDLSDGSGVESEPRRRAHQPRKPVQSHRRHREREAVLSIEAIKIKPEFPIAWNNLAGIFKEGAVAYYREALRLCPQFADAHSNLGNALKELCQIPDTRCQMPYAICHMPSRRIRRRSDFAIAHGNLGSCYYDLGDFTTAIKAFNYTIQLEPNFPDAYNNLGNALKEEGRLDEAINAYRAALHLKPDHPHAHNNLGNAMIEKGFIKETSLLRHSSK
eukprot:gene10047-10922_t